MKEFGCRDVGIDCDWKTKAPSEDEVMTRVADHARKQHGMTQLNEDMKKQIKAKIHDEKKVA